MDITTTTVDATGRTSAIPSRPQRQRGGGGGDCLRGAEGQVIPRWLSFAWLTMICVMCLVSYGEDRPALPVETSPAAYRSSLQQEVIRIRSLPKQDQLKRLLALGNSVPSIIYMSEEESFIGLAKTVVELREFDWADGLDRGLPDSREGAKKTNRIYAALWEKRADPEALRLLRSLAMRHPEEISLAGFRPGGIEYLLAILENPLAPSMERRLAVRELGVHGTNASTERLTAFADDATPVDDGSGFEFHEDEQDVPLGRYVQEAIRYIREREGGR